jgi:hypothetical protein
VTLIGASISRVSVPVVYLSVVSPSPEFQGRGREAGILGEVAYQLFAPEDFF